MDEFWRIGGCSGYIKVSIYFKFFVFFFFEDFICYDIVMCGSDGFGFVCYDVRKKNIRWSIY